MDPPAPAANQRKVERFNRTLQEEWSYARPYLSEPERVAAFPEFLRIYNHDTSTPHCEATHPSAAYPTWQVSTVRE
ncbi:hypothetical protein ABID74_003237 [Gordonia terrae]